VEIQIDYRIFIKNGSFYLVVVHLLISLDTIAELIKMFLMIIFINLSKN